MSNPKFNPGQVVITGGIDALAQGDAKFSAFVAECVARHIRGDWGDDRDPQDIRVNDDALKNGDQLLSAYRYRGNVTSLMVDDIVKIWVITDARVAGFATVTTVLLPDEY